MSERVIHQGYWHVPQPETTRGGQHVGTPRGVLVYDEDLQLGVFSFSERSQIKNVAEANALLDLAVDAQPGARRAADLTPEEREALTWAANEIRSFHWPHATGERTKAEAARAALTRILGDKP